MGRRRRSPNTSHQIRVRSRGKHEANGNFVEKTTAIGNAVEVKAMAGLGTGTRGRMLCLMPKLSKQVRATGGVAAPVMVLGAVH